MTVFTNAPTFQREPYEVRVGRGARFLDKHAYTDWYNGVHAEEVLDDDEPRRHIDLDTLRLEDGQVCVLGQLHGDYGRALNKYDLTPGGVRTDDMWEFSGGVYRRKPEGDADLDTALDRYVDEYGSGGVQYALGFSLPDDEDRDDAENRGGWGQLTDAWKVAISGRRLLHEVEKPPEPELNTYQVTTLVEATDDQEARVAAREFIDHDHDISVSLMHEGAA